MSSQTVREEPIRPSHSSLVDILAFLGAQEEYSYIDRLGNAIDLIGILEAIRDAMRAYISYCSPEGRVGGSSQEVECPEIDPEKLEREVKYLENWLSAMWYDERRGGRVEVIRFSREMAIEAYAKISKHWGKGGEEKKGEESSEGHTQRGGGGW